MKSAKATRSSNRDKGEAAQTHKHLVVKAEGFLITQLDRATRHLRTSMAHQGFR
jgi:hypothetical protein